MQYCISRSAVHSSESSGYFWQPPAPESLFSPQCTRLCTAYASVTYLFEFSTCSNLQKIKKKSLKMSHGNVLCHCWLKLCFLLPVENKTGIRCRLFIILKLSSSRHGLNESCDLFNKQWFGAVSLLCYQPFCCILLHLLFVHMLLKTFTVHTHLSNNGTCFILMCHSRPRQTITQ